MASNNSDGVPAFAIAAAQQEPSDDAYVSSQQPPSRQQAMYSQEQQQRSSQASLGGGTGETNPSQQQSPHSTPQQQPPQTRAPQYQYPSSSITSDQSNNMETPQKGTPGGPAGRQGGPERKTTTLSTKDPKEDLVLPMTQPDEETEDGLIRNKQAVEKIRDTWLYKQVKNRQDEFTNYQQATLFVGTWNVNAKGKAEDDLTRWLCADWSQTGLPDIVCVGFQEIVDLNAVNVAVDSKTQQKTQFWSEKINQTLNNAVGQNDPARNGYILLMQRSMVGLLVSVFVKRVHQPRTKYVASASVGVGVMGMMGNKGGVSVRLQFYDSTLCFVCTHLAAHRENVAGRNGDFDNVYAKTAFDVGEEAIREVIRSGSLSHWAIGSSATTIPDHDIVIWLGDLNYRVDESIQTESVLKLSESGQLHGLIPMDQLNIERAAGRVFREFQEGKLNFRPTYKYQPGTDMYEQRPDKKLRAPAWCDRILWRAQQPSHVRLLTYNRSESPNVSDHKPVYSTMRLVIKDVVAQKREAIYDELMRKLDRFDNTALPVVALDKAMLDFGEVRYGETVSLKIQITNTGNVVAQFRLAPKLDETAICKRWMSISPTYGMIIPGEEPSSLEFKVSIDNATAQNLNSGREVLDDILILRLEGGRDYYITVKASYARSCFGMSLDELVLYTKPIRSIPLDPIKKSENLDQENRAGTTALCVPKELWRIVDAIIHKGLDTPGLFVETGIADEVAQIRECLDTEARFGTYQVHSYAEALIAFLSGLSSPVVLPALFPTVEIDSQNIQSCARKLLDELPPIHYNVFVYIISLFRRALAHRRKNQLTAAKAARICCTCMAPTLDLSNSDITKTTGIQLLMIHLLETSSI